MNNNNNPIMGVFHSYWFFIEFYRDGTKYQLTESDIAELENLNYLGKLAVEHYFSDIYIPDAPKYIDIETEILDLYQKFAKDQGLDVIGYIDIVDEYSRKQNFTSSTGFVNNKIIDEKYQRTLIDRNLDVLLTI